MSIESAIRAYLKTTPVGAVVGDGIYPTVLPQASPTGSNVPAIVFNRIATDPVHHLTHEPAQLENIRIQWDCYDRSPTDVLELARLLRQALDDIGSSNFDPNYQQVRIKRTNELDLAASRDAGGEGGLYRRMIETSVWFRENFIRA